MPELPEVETVVRTVAPSITGRRIEEVTFFSPLAANHDPAGVVVRLEGRSILGVRRIGKHVLVQLDQGWIDIHLRMTGKLLADGGRETHTRALLRLDRGWLRFDDIRQFGRLVWREALPELGPDALAIREADFAALLHARRGRIKPLLLNQDVIAGVGNIYADELLFRAGVHPLAAAHRLSKPRLARVFWAMREVLEEAVAAGGSSISDYVDAEGRRGSFQEAHRVYGRGGEPCVTCGAAVRRTVVAQRGTHFCPVCQRR